MTDEEGVSITAPSIYIHVHACTVHVLANENSHTYIHVHIFFSQYALER